MSRRRHHRGPWVLLVSLGLSFLVHVPAGLKLREVLPSLLVGEKKDRGKEPVRVVRLTPEAFERSLESARRSAVRTRKTQAKRNAPEKKKPPKKKEDKSDLPKGQVVEVPASKDKRRPQKSRFLAKENSRVERETVARRELRDESKRRVTNKLQDRQSLGGPSQGIPVPGIRSEGDGGKTEKAGDTGKGKGRSKQFELQMPRLDKRDEVNLKLADLPELGSNRIWNRDRSDGFKGNADRLKLNMGSLEEEAGGRRMGEKGQQDGLPSLKDLRPTLGTIARISGSPSDDYIDDVPEGEGTFLNTRSFKYATFFYQIRDSVGPHWRTDVRREMRRRDPTGDIYGPGDLKTLLFIRLDDSGRLSEVRVAESSGYDFLDAVAVRAFKKAESFPNPPKGIVDSEGHINFHFAFVLYTGRRGPLNIFR